MRRSWLYFASRSERLSEPVYLAAGRRHCDVGDRSVLGFANSFMLKNSKPEIVLAGALAV
jgi:hypothetical protein